MLSSNYTHILSNVHTLFCNLEESLFYKIKKYLFCALFVFCDKAFGNLNNVWMERNFKEQNIFLCNAYSLVDEFSSHAIHL